MRQPRMRRQEAPTDECGQCREQNGRHEHLRDAIDELFDRRASPLSLAHPRAGAGVAPASGRCDGFGTAKISSAAMTHSTPAKKNAGR